MKIINKETQLVRKEIVTEEYDLCDKCNNRIKNDRFEVHECHIEYNTGKLYPEGGSGLIQEVDLCQTCAKDLMTLLKDNGYRVNQREWES